MVQAGLLAAASFPFPAGTVAAMCLIRKAMMASLGVIAVGLLPACSASMSFTNSPASQPARTPAHVQQAPATAAPLVTGRLSPAGTALAVTDLNGSTYAITLVKMLDPAQPAGLADAAVSGTHLVGAEFTLRGLSGHISDNADDDAVIEGSDHHVYQAALGAVSAGADFSGGRFSIASGQAVTGWVAFQVRDGVKPLLVQWIPDAGTDSTAIRWSA
jgi:hypothetical protein